MGVLTTTSSDYNGLAFFHPTGTSIATLAGGVDTVHTIKILPEVEKVIFQKEYTIVVWNDKTRTVVKCSEEDFDKEKGFAMAIAKKMLKRNEFKRLLENADIQDK